MKLFCLFLVFFYHSANAEGIPALLKKLENKYNDKKTLIAVFTQVNESTHLKTKKKSSGVISVKRSGKIRWETQKPDPNIFISNGNTFWFYTPPFQDGDHGQLIIQKASQIQSQLASALLSGSFSTLKKLRVNKISDTKFELFPEKGTAGDVKTAIIEVEPKNLLIERVILKFFNGNISDIKLSQVYLGKQLGDDMFNFKAPPNTDIVRR